MPDRDYYLDPSPRMAGIRARYQTHIAALLRLASVADAEAVAARVFMLEQRIAKAHAPRLDTDDIVKSNNPWARKDFDRRAPGLDWQAFFSAAGLSEQPRFIVWHPGAITGIHGHRGARAWAASRDLEGVPDLPCYLAGGPGAA
jgi:predicted metalloendopeptidase